MVWVGGLDSWDTFVNRIIAILGYPENLKYQPKPPIYHELIVAFFPMDLATQKA